MPVLGAKRKLGPSVHFLPVLGSMSVDLARFPRKLMRRRLFIAGLATTALSPLLARAQQTAKLPRLGFIGSSTASAMNSWIAAFTKRLGELGWIENHTVTIDYQ